MGTFSKTFFNKFIETTTGKVLDIGSGPGRDGLVLQKAGLEVICVDASHTMLELCRQKGLTTVQADFNTIPFLDSHFDGVWAYTSLLHIPKSEIHVPLREIKRVLKKNGIFGLGLIEGKFEGYKESTKVTAPRWFSYYTVEEVEVLLKQYGFELLYFETFTPNSKNYLNFIARSM